MMPLTPHLMDNTYDVYGRSKTYVEITPRCPICKQTPQMEVRGWWKTRCRVECECGVCSAYSISKSDRMRCALENWVALVNHINRGKKHFFGRRHSKAQRFD